MPQDGLEGGGLLSIAVGEEGEGRRTYGASDADGNAHRETITHR